MKYLKAAGRRLALYLDVAVRNMRRPRAIASICCICAAAMSSSLKRRVFVEW